MAEEKGARVSRFTKPIVTTEKVKESTALEQLTKNWNGVIDGLILARGHWEEMQKILASVPRDLVQLAPIPVQKACMRFRKANFNVMLSRFADYYRAFGGLESMRVKGAEKDGR